MPYSSYEEVLAVRAAESSPKPSVCPKVIIEDAVAEDWKKRQWQLDLLDDEELLSIIKDECLHPRWKYGNTKIHDDPEGGWRSGLVCCVCGRLVDDYYDYDGYE